MTHIKMLSFRIQSQFVIVPKHFYLTFALFHCFFFDCKYFTTSLAQMNFLTDPFTWQVFVFVAVVSAVILIIVYLYKNDKKMMVFFVLGGPGAGKGTQCAKLNKIFPNLISLSTGQLLRQMTKERKTARAIEVCIPIGN